MATFTFEEQRVIIRFFHLRGMKPIKIHQQLSETWMPMFNPETKRQSAQWKHTNSPPPKKFRVTAIAEKMMVAMFWDSEGVILTHCIPKKTTVTGETYEDVLRTKFLPALREKRPKMVAAVFFHHVLFPHTFFSSKTKRKFDMVKKRYCFLNKHQ
jgi:hypothetical protein